MEERERRKIKEGIRGRREEGKEEERERKGER